MKGATVVTCQLLFPLVLPGDRPLRLTHPQWEMQHWAAGVAVKMGAKTWRIIPWHQIEFCDIEAQTETAAQ